MLDEEWEPSVVVSQAYDIHEVLTEMDYYRFCDYWNKRAALKSKATAGAGSWEEP